MKIKKVIVGIAAFNHDSSACVIVDGKLLAFAEEERFNRQKHSGEFPIQAIKYCLKNAGCIIPDISEIAFYFDPRRCFRSYLRHANPFFAFTDASVFTRKRFYYEAVWLAGFINKIHSIKRILKRPDLKVTYVNHHLAHAFYGYYASGGKDALVVSNDSVGEDVSTLIAHFRQNQNKSVKYKKLLEQLDPHSLGYLYGAVTEYLGFRRGNGEGKVMALASFGTDKYCRYFENAVEYLPNGEFRIKDDLIIRRSFQPKGQRLSNRFYQQFGKRDESDDFTQHEYDIAFALQSVTEKIVYHQLDHYSKEAKQIVLTGGVAQNSVLNGKILERYPAKKIFVPPIPTDAGCSIGAALKLHWDHTGKLPKFVDTAFLGPEYGDHEIEEVLTNSKLKYKKIANPVDFLVDKLQQGKVVAISRDRMECGPRALCNRSILASPVTTSMKDYLNNSVKYREAFRPYGGFILEEEVAQVFSYKNKNVAGPYMTFVLNTKKDWLKKIPALTHVDGTCRVQIVKPSQSPFLAKLLRAFKRKTGVPILINTSLNMNGFPIARTTQDVLNAFVNSGIDYVLFNNKYLVSK